MLVITSLFILITAASDSDFENWKRIASTTNCTDTPGWTYKDYTCLTYAPEFCLYGKPDPDFSKKFGSLFRYPEKHCCACGRIDYLAGGEVVNRKNKNAWLILTIVIPCFIQILCQYLGQ